MIKKKWFLYATEFFAGMSVMAVELGASRLLAPYFSSSQIVWTIIIGTIMIAMALGNVIGGRLADKKPNPDRLYFLLLISALWIALIPFLGKYIIGGISLVLALIISHNFLIWASFACCMVLFVFPLLLLGMVTPTLIKHSVDNLEQNGKIVGELGALNTIGSILGTFLPTFVLIPNVGTALTFIIFAVILFTLSAIYFIYSKKKLIRCSIAAVAVISLGIASNKHSFSLTQEGIIYEGESMYNYLRVTEDEDEIALSTNVLFGVQSVKIKNGTLTGMYYDYALAAPYMAGLSNKSQQDVLILGLGTGTYATQILNYFPNANVDGVEIDGKIVDLAIKYFDLPSKVNVAIEDGRAYMQNAGKYDVIMVDAYQDITIPFQMSTVEFFKIVKSHLKENGVMVVNLNMFSTKAGTINEYLCDTIASVFSKVYKQDVSGSSNCEVFASDNVNMMSDFANNIISSDPDLRYYLDEVNDEIEVINKGKKILTDDKAPVELLGMGVLDDMINKELAYYRGKSLKEILDMFM